MLSNMKLKLAEQLHDISPHIETNRNTKTIMQDVIIAMMPAFIGSIYFFGIRSLILVLASVTTCILSEYV